MVEVLKRDLMATVSFTDKESHFAFGSALHEALAGEQDYADSNIILNIDEKDVFGNRQVQLSTWSNNKTKVTLQIKVERTDGTTVTVDHYGRVVKTVPMSDSIIGSWTQEIRFRNARSNDTDDKISEASKHLIKEITITHKNIEEKYASLEASSSMPTKPGVFCPKFSQLNEDENKEEKKDAE